MYQVACLCNIVSKLKHEQKDFTNILCDNKFVITLTKNLIF